MCNLEFLGGRREDTAAHIRLWIWSLVFLCRKTRKYEKCHERHISTKLRSFPWLWPQSSKGTTCLRCAYLRDTSCPLENAVQGEWRWFNVSLFEPIHGSDETECLEKEVRSIWGDIEDVVGNRGKVSEPPLTSTWLLLRPHWWSRHDSVHNISQLLYASVSPALKCVNNAYLWGLLRGFNECNAQDVSGL